MRFTTLAASGTVLVWCGIAAVAAAPGRPLTSAKTVPASPAPVKPAAGAAASAARPGASPADAAFFEKEVRPLLAEQCYSCHGSKVQQAGLRVDSRAALLKGGDKGPSLVPGHPEKSLLLKAVRHEGLKMPPGRKLPEKQAAALEKWLRMGAPWPGDTGQAAAAPKSWDEVVKVRKQWWSLQPVRKVTVPPVKNAAWSANPVDRFLLNKLEKQGIKPVAAADRRTLARRVYLTLLGLPPTPDEIEAFVNDKAPNAYEKLVDRALASPHYGERWARHWMDVVRFGETHGYEWNYEVRDAWRYRDYLIRAFNQDVPYNQFIREHLAGDLLPKPRWNAQDKINESVIGTAFYRFGENGHDVFKEIGLDVLDNQIDTLSKAFQATTVSCARCHDHKLDAVSTKDYYALLGTLVSSRQVANTLDSPEVNAPRTARLRELKTQIKSELAAQWSRDAQDAARYLRAAQAAREKAADAADLAQGLDPKRLQAWVTALEKKAAGLEDPLHAWSTAAESAKTAGTPEAAWKQLATTYQTEKQTRTESNSKKFTPFGDFRQGKADGWRVDGLGLRDGGVRSGDFAVAPEGDTAVSTIFPAGLFTHSLSQRLNGSMQSPWLGNDKKLISLQVMGGAGGVLREIPDQRQLTDSGRELKSDTPTWITLGRSTRDEWVYLELITKFHNPRFAEGDKENPRSFFGITQAVLHDEGGAPKDDLGRMERLFTGAEPKTLDDVAGRYAAVLQGAVSAWAGGSATDDDVRWLDWTVRQGLLGNSTGQNPKLAELVTQYRNVEKELEPARLVAGMADLNPGFDVPVYLRGDFRNKGEIVPRRYIEVLCGGNAADTAEGSGRWELAERIADAKNPLTARVMVNRVWHYLFGTGLVRTPDDFGHMGELPSHPELLDYLATRFSQEGWSVKRLVRTLMLTRTFQMTGQASARGIAVDPENRLLHHFPARRLEAETIRDSILAVSGRLDRTLYGPSIQPFRDDPKPERRLFGGPLDGNGRRSVYTKITLMEGPKFLCVFNFPDPKVATGKRDVTNVPAQALSLLNDPFVIGQADYWSERLVAAPDATVGARIDRMFRAAVGHAPDKATADRFERIVKELATLHEVKAGEELKSRVLWKDVAHAMFNMKEFIYVR